MGIYTTSNGAIKCHSGGKNTKLSINAAEAQFIKTVMDKFGKTINGSNDNSNFICLRSNKNLTLLDSGEVLITLKPAYRKYIIDIATKHEPKVSREIIVPKTYMITKAELKQAFALVSKARIKSCHFIGNSRARKCPLLPSDKMFIEKLQESLTKSMGIRYF